MRKRKRKEKEMSLVSGILCVLAAGSGKRRKQI